MGRNYGDYGQLHDGYCLLHMTVNELYPLISTPTFLQVYMLSVDAVVQYREDFAR